MNYLILLLPATAFASSGAYSFAVYAFNAVFAFSLIVFIEGRIFQKAGSVSPYRRSLALIFFSSNAGNLLASVIGYASPVARDIFLESVFGPPKPLTIPIALSIHFCLSLGLEWILAKFLKFDVERLKLLRAKVTSYATIGVLIALYRLLIP